MNVFFFFSETLFSLLLAKTSEQNFLKRFTAVLCKPAGWLVGRLVNDGCLVLGWLIWAVLATLIIKHRHWNSHWRFHKFTDKVSFFQSFGSYRFYFDFMEVFLGCCNHILSLGILSVRPPLVRPFIHCVFPKVCKKDFIIFVSVNFWQFYGMTFFIISELFIPGL